MTTGAENLIPRDGSDPIRELCHDLRQPLAAILALVEAAALEPGLSPVVRRRLTQIAEQAEVGVDLARATSEQAPARPIDIADVLADMVSVRRMLYGGTIALLTTGELTINGDTAGVRRALTNIVGNAERAAGPDGTVEIVARRIDAHVIVDVEDSGPGFGNAPSGTAQLGLRIADRVARSHQGAVTIMQEDGTRTRVRISLRDSIETHALASSYLRGSGRT